MSKSLKLTAIGVAALLALGTISFNFADRNIAPIPDDLEVITLGKASPDYLILSAARAIPMPSEGPLGLGRSASPDEIASWDIDVRPDGVGLPLGSGDVLTGEEIFVEQCAVCHGDFGEGVDRWPVLTGGIDTLTNDRPVKTTGSYWPYLSTVWDYIHRAMPFGAAQTLEDDEVYAIVAYLMYMNDLVDEDFELSHENFLDVRLPNEEGFFFDDRESAELPLFTKAEVCMENCKPAVEITARAQVVDVTPESEEGPLTFGGAAPAHGEKAMAMNTAPATDAADAATAEEAPAPDAFDGAVLAQGEKVFKKCKACHEAELAKNKSGPHLNGVYGRDIGGLGDFKYSKTLAQMGGQWNDETLGGFLSNPRGYAKDTKMAFKGIADPEDIAAVIAYLRSVAP